MLQTQKGVRKSILSAAMFVLACVAVYLLTACASLSMGGCSFGNTDNTEESLRDTTPVVLEASQPGNAVMADDSAVLDFSYASEGYISVMSNLGDIKVKVLVEKDGAKYQYTIDSAGYYIVIPLSLGSGVYSVGVWQNIAGDSYAAVFSQDIDVALNDEFTPFLYPNQFVDFSAGDEATTLSQELAEGSVTDVDVVNKIYRWVCDNIEYDTEKATVLATATGYLPKNADTISSKDGICFDYAVLTVSMLRAQSVPAKLVIGYAGTAYHAWIEVHCVDSGAVMSYNFDGEKWVLMDPTFDAASGGLQDLSSVIGDGTNYQPMLYY